MIFKKALFDYAKKVNFRSIPESDPELPVKSDTE